MKVLIDTNVILDVLCDRKDFVEASSEIFRLCEIGKINGYVSALSIPNIIYIMRRELNREKTKEIVSRLFLIFGVVDLKAEELKKAVALDFDDFEDSLQSVSAAAIGADYIVTRNVKDFSASQILPLTPRELLDRTVREFRK